MRPRSLRLLSGAALVSCCAVSFALSAASPTRPSHGSSTLSPWDAAEQGRDSLESLPQSDRTRAAYTAAMNRFRDLYHDAPRDIHAAAAVNAVAELLAEQGRTLHDPKSLKAAIGQYEFLRLQYPGSSLRVGALLAEGQIYANDLNDARAARERYALLLKQYPGNGLADQARAGIAELNTSHEPDFASALPGPSSTSARTPATPSSNQATLQSATTPQHTEDTPHSPSPAATEPAGPSEPATVASSVEKKHHGPLAQVTGIRHWSTGSYTRVAIDLGDDVTYEAARVPNPDRIYFDLHGTRLARQLVGKSFAVTDDGFLKKIRAAQFSDDMTRIVLDVNEVTEYSAFLLPNPYRLIIDIHGAGKDAAASSPPAPVQGDPAPAPRVAVVMKSSPGRPVPNTVASKSANAATDVAAVSGQPGRVEATSVPTSQPISAIVRDREPSSLASASSTDSPAASEPHPLASPRTRRSRKDSVPAEPAHAALPTQDGQTSLVRALGLKIGRIVIDAGHGGHDSGTLGVDGLEEKDVVLDVALRLGKLLHDRLGAEVVYTRSDDTFIPLETRTAIANKAQADLFLSIHANSSSEPSARGVETYYLNFTSQPDSLEVAARENAVSDQSIHQLSDLVKKIALKEKIDESREFAGDVEKSLYGGLEKGNAGLKDRGVKKAPFVVLIGANMPSILAEISFVTNPRDARQLRQPEYRERVAESLYKGVARYAGGLSGVKGPTERASIQ